MAAADSKAEQVPYLTDPTGREHPLTGEQITIGRAVECDIVVTSKRVSREHSRVRRDGWRVMLEDPYVQQAMGLFRSLTLALVGIGAVEPSKLLAASGNVFSPRELQSLRDRGAVGDICLRFFDAMGTPITTPLNDRVIAIELADLKRVDRVVGIAGGRRKTEAILGALRGRLINVVITDRATAERLVREASSAAKPHRATAKARARKSKRGT